MSMFNPKRVFAFTHSARATDHYADPGVSAVAPKDGAEQTWIATKADEWFVGTPDKDHSDAFVCLALCQDEYPKAWSKAFSPVWVKWANKCLSNPVFARAFPAVDVDPKDKRATPHWNAALSDQQVVRAVLRIAQDLQSEKGRGGFSAADLKRLTGLLAATLPEEHEEIKRLAKSTMDSALQGGVSSRLPIPSRLKQLVIPANEEHGMDVVVSPLAALPMLRMLRELQDVAGESKQGFFAARSRFNGWQTKVDKPQNSGIPGAGGLRAMRQHYRSFKAAARRAQIDMDYSTIQGLVKALKSQRAYIAKNALKAPGEMARSDLREAVLIAAQSVAQSILDQSEWLRQAVQDESMRFEDAQSLMVDAITKALRDQPKGFFAKPAELQQIAQACGNCLSRIEEVTA